MKTYLIIINLIFLISCTKHKNPKSINKDFVCENKIDSFCFPNDLELLEEKKYVCDNTLPFAKNEKIDLYKKMNIIFSDKNYILINFDRKTKILFDKKQKLLIAFKATEIDNFYFNKPNYKELYPLTFYILDEKLLPKYHFNGKTISVFKDNVKMNKFEEYKIVMNDKHLNKNYELFNYSDLIEVVKELNKGNYEINENIGTDILNYFYKDEPIWVEI